VASAGSGAVKLASETKRATRLTPHFQRDMIYPPRPVKCYRGGGFGKARDDNGVTLRPAGTRHAQRGW
jgi:hypothetical protein